jgi:hypothetical protein
VRAEFRAVINCVHYNPATGEIRQVSTGGAPPELAGYAVAEFENVTYWDILDTTQWRVEVNTLQQRAGNIPSCRLARIN